MAGSTNAACTQNECRKGGGGRTELLAGARGITKNAPSASMEGEPVRAGTACHVSALTGTGSLLVLRFFEKGRKVPCFTFDRVRLFNRYYKNGCPISSGWK